MFLLHAVLKNRINYEIIIMEYFILLFLETKLISLAKENHCNLTERSWPAKWVGRLSLPKHVLQILLLQ